MVAGTLVDKEIDAGRLLLEQLDREQIEVVAAFWLYNAEYDRWRLVLAMPLCDQKGPLVAYTTIQKAMSSLPNEKRLSLLDITAENTKNFIVEAIRRFVHTGTSINPIRVSRSSVNGVYVDDAVVYRTA